MYRNAIFGSGVEESEPESINAVGLTIFPLRVQTSLRFSWRMPGNINKFHYQTRERFREDHCEWQEQICRSPKQEIQTRKPRNVVSIYDHPSVQTPAT